MSFANMLARPPDLVLQLPSLKATQCLGLQLGKGLQAVAGSPVVLLEGAMASGKTTLCKKLCQGLGIDPQLVTSPSYTLVNVYPSEKTVYHADFFRLADSQDLLNLDSSDWRNPHGPTLIEWPQPVTDYLNPQECLWIRLQAPHHAHDHPQHNQQRTLSFWGSPPFVPLLRSLADSPILP